MNSKDKEYDGKKKISWGQCNWAPAHILRIVTQDNLHLYNKQVLNELKLKGYYFKLGGSI